MVGTVGSKTDGAGANILLARKVHGQFSDILQRPGQRDVHAQFSHAAHQVEVVFFSHQYPAIQKMKIGGNSITFQRPTGCFLRKNHHLNLKK